MSDLKERAREFHAKKRLGQNFLTNADRLSQIAAALNIKPGERVLEIGPGLGFLTKVLSQSGAYLTAVELDGQCVRMLNELSLPHLSLIESDFLTCDLSKILSEKTKVVGNIPYNITSPIIAKLLGEIGEPSPWLSAIDSIVLTVQREVALRLVASAGDDHYSQISLLIEYFAEAEMLFSIEPEEFYPVPEVRSAVVRIKPRLKPPIQCRNHKLLRQIIQAGFRQRRKMLKNNLAFLKLHQVEILAVFGRLNFDPQVRAERLSLKQFALLTDAFLDMIVDSGEVGKGASSAV
jgi:16S rRNA (adenine1518-N6/adenine1519-N6)-dimethyltransferase